MNIDLITLWICSSISQWLWLTIVWVRVTRCSQELTGLRNSLRALAAQPSTLHKYREVN